MTSFFLLIFTALWTAWQLSQSILMGVWGKPFNPLEGIAFIGSIGLLVSAYTALFSLRKATWIAICAIALLWVDYLPAVITSIPQLQTVQLREGLMAFGPVLLLGYTTSIFSFKTVQLLGKGPDRSVRFVECPRLFRILILSVTGLAIFSFVAVDLFFIGKDRESEQKVTWAFERIDGRDAVKMTFSDLPGFNYIETDSKEVIDYLRSQRPKTPVIRVTLTYDFNKVRALNLDHAYLGNIRFIPYLERLH